MSQEPNSSNIGFVEEMLADYLRDPSSVSDAWRRFFERSESKPTNGMRAWRPGPARGGPGYFTAGGPAAPGDHGADSRSVTSLQHLVDQLIRNYRVRGHMVAAIDPLGIPREEPPELDLEYWGFTETDLDRSFSFGPRYALETLTLRQIVEKLRNTYCRSIGVQFMHIDDLAVREWLQARMEKSENRLQLSRDEQIDILRRLTDAIMFEEFIQKKYIGAKSFSLEGGETLIPLLALAIEAAGAQGIDEIVMAMAHRGRLNVLCNVVGKSAKKIFREFEDVDARLHLGRGDVKYHLGFSGDWQTNAGRTVHLSLCFNPSHLEYVNGVALGRTRAKQDRFGDDERRRAMPVLIHGDASFIGEGVVQECLNMSELPAYRVGGALHVIVNNQIGFTTTPEQGRSSVYATDVAKMLQIPIFHVNGEDPEAVAQVVRLAMDFRYEFQRDVVIDMYCYRRRGHNEGDEPAFTQPVLYKAIDERKSVREGYVEHLVSLGEVSEEEADQIAERRREHLEHELAVAKDRDYPFEIDVPRGIWDGYAGGRDREVEDPETGVPRKRIAALLQRLAETPEEFKLNSKIRRGLDLRAKMAAGERNLDWAAAEALSFATLATEGIRIRLTGQDSERGTFSQRHAVLHDVQDGDTMMPLMRLAEDQAPVEIANSPLSEAGVLGFEYGYSLDCPDGLILWEAQFGDFCNAAQVIIDQFICSAEDKWRRLSGVTLLLPHGFEGQGPEHSSARLERFLMLAADDNIQIVYPTTPAQYFHVLRRQVIRRWRKPLVVMTPKSLLRHGEATSPLDDCAAGRFRRVIPDPVIEDFSEVNRLLLCTGKVYYDLVERRKELGRQDVAIVRLEQLYPFPADELSEALAGYSDDTPVLWVQEEPENMGAWRFLRARFGSQLVNRLPFGGVLRPASASPATGSKASHKLEQDRLLNQAFAGPDSGLSCDEDVIETTT